MAVSWQSEFGTSRKFTPPSFALSKEWHDSSYHNDTCPSYHNVNAGLQVYVDFDNPEDRETEDSMRFSLYEVDSDACMISDAPIFSTDSEADLVAQIVRHREELALKNN